MSDLPFLNNLADISMDHEHGSEFAEVQATAALSSSPSQSASIQKLTSSPWISDDVMSHCTSCHKPFHDIFNRRHHCRLCGKIFCHDCSAQRALIPPSSIVLIPKGGKKVKNHQRFGTQSNDTSNNTSTTTTTNTSSEEHGSLSDHHPQQQRHQQNIQATFETDPDPDCTVTYLKREKIKMKTDLKTHETTSSQIVEDVSTTTPWSFDTHEHTSNGFHNYPREGYTEDDDLYSLSGIASVDLSSQGLETSHQPLYPSSSSSSKPKDHLATIDPRATDDDDDDEEEDVTSLLYGKGLEERIKLAREPLRVCRMCFEQLQHVQEELRLCNSNAMRYNAIDPTDARRLLNSPLAFTLGHEIRKAAYTLNNLLPLPKRMGAFVVPSTSSSSSYFYGTEGNFRFSTSTHHPNRTTEECQNACQTVSGNFSNLDGVRIPARLLERAKGVAVMTVIKGGLGFAGFEFGTGLVVARLGDGNEWSPPCAIGMAGVSWGALVGAQVSDHVFLLMTDTAVDIMSNNEGSFQLGADIGVAVGPLGRSLEADISAATGTGLDAGGVALAPIYTYSLSKGLYAGISLDGKVIVTRHRVNERFYGQAVDARALLNGDVATPPAAQPLYDALKRCHVYAGGAGRREASFTSIGAQNHKSLYYQYNVKSRDF